MAHKQLLSVTKELNILYVEDEEGVRVVINKIFKELFHGVDIAVDGMDGLKKYNEYYVNNGKYYDLVITDITMPNIDGIEMCKNILKNNNEQQILVISAHDESDKLLSLMKLGIHYFIQKPMDIIDLTKVLDKICSYIVRQKEHKNKILEIKQTVVDLETDLKRAVHDKQSFEEEVFGLYTLLENYAISSLTDKNGIILDVNYEFEKVSGYKKNEIIGESFDLFRDINVCNTIRDSLANVSIFRGEMKNLKNHTNGEYYYTDLIVLPMIKDEKIYGFKFIEENITEERSINTILENIFGTDTDVDDYLIL